MLILQPIHQSSTRPTSTSWRELPKFSTISQEPKSASTSAKVKLEALMPVDGLCNPALNSQCQWAMTPLSVASHGTTGIRNHSLRIVKKLINKLQSLIGLSISLEEGIHQRTLPRLRTLFSRMVTSILGTPVVLLRTSQVIPSPSSLRAQRIIWTWDHLIQLTAPDQAQLLRLDLWRPCTLRIGFKITRKWSLPNLIYDQIS
jgi:hypothetical protein